MTNTAQANNHRNYHRELLSNLCQTIRQQAPFCGAEIQPDEQIFLDQLENLVHQLDGDEDVNFNGQQLLCKIISSYSHLTPLVARDLLWFFGGDCLHFMPDDEISNYQQLDEHRFEAESESRDFNYEQERAKIFGLH